MGKFGEQVYRLLEQVPSGKVTTYKALAEAIDTKTYQAVGQAVRNNPYFPEVPCHRVVKANGQLGGFCGQTQGKKITEKANLLKKEGLQINKNQIQDFNLKFFQDFKKKTQK